jgi:hypothetical protein
VFTTSGSRNGEPTTGALHAVVIHALGRPAAAPKLSPLPALADRALAGGRPRSTTTTAVLRGGRARRSSARGLFLRAASGRRRGEFYRYHDTGYFEDPLLSIGAGAIAIGPGRSQDASSLGPFPGTEWRVNHAAWTFVQKHWTALLPKLSSWRMRLVRRKAGIVPRQGARDIKTFFTANRARCQSPRPDDRTDQRLHQIKEAGSGCREMACRKQEQETISVLKRARPDRMRRLRNSVRCRMTAARSAASGAGRRGPASGGAEGREFCCGYDDSNVVVTHEPARCARQRST